MPDCKKTALTTFILVLNLFYSFTVVFINGLFQNYKFPRFQRGFGGPTFPWGSQMLIYIEFTIFLGGGSFYCVCEHQSFGRNLEALPGVLGNRGKRVFISGEQGNKGQILRGTGEQRQYWGTGNIRKQIFDFWGTGEQANLFQGNR